jgi:homoserine acetyltransferase
MLKEELTMTKAFSMHDIDVKAFVQALDQCKGRVLLVTSENDQFNLKSKLSQLAGIMNLIEGGRLVEAKIVCDNPEDESLLFRMNLFGEK